MSELNQVLWLRLEDLLCGHKIDKKVKYWSNGQHYQNIYALIVDNPD
ncbi:MAG: hypothetical protein KME49_18140 [Brasilonema octagenarum HA4186-MV1]|nr:MULTISPECIES: hypothetical protein [Brasilonema]MBW4627366.1 hypothetical protein [Brasilonema octagenarum HA4186-MV1]